LNVSWWPQSLFFEAIVDEIGTKGFCRPAGEEGFEIQMRVNLMGKGMRGDNALGSGWHFFQKSIKSAV